MFSPRIVIKKYGPVKKKFKKVVDSKNVTNEITEEHIEEETTVVEEKTTKNNKKKSKKDMATITEEQIATAELMANGLENKKVIKKDKGLIERTESSKIILTEDNRQLLND